MPIIKSPHAPAKYQTGFSLLEVLITLVVSAFALMALAGLQLSSVNLTTKSSANIHTMVAIKEMVTQLQANREAAIAGDFNIAATDSNGTLPTFTVNETPSDLNFAQMISYQWFNNLNNKVPGVKAGIHCNASGMCAIKVQLSESVENMEQIISVQL